MDTKSIEAKMLLNVQDLQALGLSRTMSYRLMHKSDMPVIRLGDRLFMHKDRFFQWLEEQSTKGAEA